MIIHLYGYPCSGKTTLGTALCKALQNSIILDGDVIRAGLNADLSFTTEDRLENLRRLGCLATLLSNQGYNVIICTVAPTHECRDIVKSNSGDNNYISVFVNTPLSVCIDRDTKGMYGQAINNERTNFTGVHHMIEIGNPDIIVEADNIVNQIRYILSNIL